MSDAADLIFSVIPPSLVLILGYLTRRVIFSLICGIIAAAFIASKFSILNTLTLAANSLWQNLEFNKFFSTQHFWDTYNLFICIFLLILGVFVTMLQHSGGAYAYQNYIKNYIKTKQQAEKASLLLSTALFIDDYLSSLTVGSVMYPLTDAHRVPRAKLAFLVDSMAAPLAILCPFSSWVAFILGLLRENSVSYKQPLMAYFLSLPFLFYSLTLIACMWFIVCKKISFGPMKQHEQIASQTGNLTGNKPDPYAKKKDFDHNPKHTTLIDFFIPIGILLICVLAGLLYSGDCVLFGGKLPILSALQNSNAAIGLFLGGSAACLICITFFLVRKKINATELPGIIWHGITLMLPAIVVLFLAWALGDILRHELKTGEHIANLMLGTVSLNLLPVILFAAALLIAFAIGSSWGTAAMLFPIAVPLVTNLGGESTPMVFPVLGALLSGCVAGDHMSPISDTTIMSATSSRASHIEHVQTQLPFSLPIAATTGIAFVLTSFLMPYGFIAAILGSLSVSIGLSMIILKLLSSSK